MIIVHHKQFIKVLRYATPRFFNVPVHVDDYRQIAVIYQIKQVQVESIYSHRLTLFKTLKVRDNLRRRSVSNGS